MAISEHGVLTEGRAMEGRWCRDRAREVAVRPRNVAFAARPAQGTAPSGVGVAVSHTTIGVRRTAVQSGRCRRSTFSCGVVADRANIGVEAVGCLRRPPARALLREDESSCLAV